MDFDELKKALKLRRDCNRMSFEEFIEEFSKYIDFKISQKEIEEWEFSGLLNTDFFNMWVKY